MYTVLWKWSRSELLPGVSLWRREVNPPTGYGWRRTKPWRITEKKQEVLRGNSAKCRRAHHRVGCAVAAETGTSCVQWRQSEGRNREGRAPGFLAALPLGQGMHHGQRQQPGRVIFRASCRRAVTIAGAKQEEPEQQFWSPFNTEKGSKSDALKAEVTGGGGWDEWRDWGWRIYTTMCKTDN